MNRRAWYKSFLDKSTVHRFKKIGDLGEYLAGLLLAKAGFEQIVNLNNEKKNTKYFDLIANRDNQSFAISVKARNKFENSVAGEKLNARYKLTDNPKLFEIEARETYDSLPAWLVIPIDVDLGTFDAYFGQLKDLRGNKKGISLSPDATKRYESLAWQESFDNVGISKEEIQMLKNKYARR